MGDWADGEFRHAKLVYGEDYWSVVVPGTKGVYVANVDAFARPARISREPLAKEWLNLVASREGQDVFNARKGSISARMDADPTVYPPYQRSALADFKSAKSIVPASGAAMPQVYYSRLEPVILAFASDLNVEKADQGLAAASHDLHSTFTRVWSLK
jgi:glucose/mannose transport system substrate-binding protein